MSTTTTDRQPIRDGVCPYPFVRSTASPFDPAAEVTPLRQDQPISRVRLWNGKEAWLITRLADVRAILSDERFSAMTAHANYPTLSAGHAASKTQDASFLRKDDPIHRVHRRLWQPFFSAANITALRPRVQQVVDQAISDLVAAGEPADLWRHVALPIPSHVIGSLLDIPEADHEFFQTASAVRQDISQSFEATSKANKALDDYWSRLIDERTAQPGNDLVSRLIVSEVAAGRLTKNELIAMAQLVLFAGHGTTSDMIALGTLVLLQNPQAIAQLRADASVIPRIVEELLRYLTIAHNGLQRVALQDVEVGGVLIRAGEGVILHVASANRDETAFERADVFSPDRPAFFHVAFGAGAHACIGAPLARAELQIVFETLFRRLPHLRLAEPLSNLRFRVSGLFYGVDRVPVAWSAD